MVAAWVSPGRVVVTRVAAAAVIDVDPEEAVAAMSAVRDEGGAVFGVDEVRVVPCVVGVPGDDAAALRPKSSMMLMGLESTVRAP